MSFPEGTRWFVQTRTDTLMRHLPDQAGSRDETYSRSFTRGRTPT